MAIGKYRQFTKFPDDPSIGSAAREALDSMLAQINALAGLGNAPTGQGIQALSQNQIDPTTGQIISVGSRASSVTTAITYTTTTTSVTFFWDGTNGSSVFQIARDDGTLTPPSVVGSPYTVTGLSPNTKYFFYPYYDEAMGLIRWASIVNVSVGTPNIAFTAKSLQAAQQQILRGRIPLGLLLPVTGLTTPASGTGSGSGGSGAGGGGGGGGGDYVL